MNVVGMLLILTGMMLLSQQGAVDPGAVDPSYPCEGSAALLNSWVTQMDELQEAHEALIPDLGAQKGLCPRLGGAFGTI